jgi:hypothetical protein
MQAASMNNTFDNDGFLDEIHFDEDLSAFSPGTKMLDSPEPKHQQSFMSKQSARWIDEEVSTALPVRFLVCIIGILSMSFNLTHHSPISPFQ